MIPGRAAFEPCPSNYHPRSSVSIDELREDFRARFDARPRVFRAPGRVNLIGEHTDYNEGFVMPAATQFAARVAAAPREGRVVTVFSREVGEGFEFDLDDEDARPRSSWTDYVQGVAVVFRRAGFRLAGARLLVESDVPMGAGMSSSAALEVSAALALLGVAGESAPPLEVVRLCREAENEFVGARVGVMDQFASCFGRAGHALLLDCRTLEAEALPIPSQARLVVCNTMVRHSLAGGEYNERRADCEEAARRLGVRALRDVGTEELAARALELPERLRRRARHVVTENARALEAAGALRAGDLETFGRLMDESHLSLRDDYEVSVAELDMMVELARRVPGVYGARMMGGGFGGCTINLVHETAVEHVLAEVARGYERETGVRPDTYVCRAADGAGEVS